MIASLLRGITRFKKENSWMPEVGLWKQLGGGATIYFGQRVSHKFGRIYDKHAESGLDHYKKCLRFEMELKGKLAWTTVNDIYSRKQSVSTPAGQLEVQNTVRNYVAQYFLERGTRVRFAVEGLSLLRSAQVKADVQRELEWLDYQVSPTINRLCSAGYGQRAYEILFGSVRGWDSSQTGAPEDDRSQANVAGKIMGHTEGGIDNEC